MSMLQKQREELIKLHAKTMVGYRPRPSRLITSVEEPTQIYPQPLPPLFLFRASRHKTSPCQSILAPSNRLLNPAGPGSLRTLLSRVCCFEPPVLLSFLSFFLATITGTDDLVTR